MHERLLSVDTLRFMKDPSKINILSFEHICHKSSLHLTSFSFVFMEYPFEILVKQDKHVILRLYEFSAYNCNTSGDISRDRHTKISNISEDTVCEITHLCYYFKTFQLETPLYTFIYCSSFQ